MTATPMSLEQSMNSCCQLARRTGGNFHWTFLTLPRDQYRAMCALYAYLRLSDDLSDDVKISPAEREANLAAWRAETADALAGRPTRSPVFPALSDTVQRYHVSPAVLMELLDGVTSDQQFQSMASFPDLERYCYLVAGTVGLCCIKIWGASDPAAEPFAIDCGAAFQLTNILRDVSEDAALGRVYLPADELARFGVSTDDLRSARLTPAVRELFQFQATRARQYYDRSAGLTTYLPPAGRRIFAAMRSVYGGVLREIERRRYDVFRERVSLPAWKKALLVARAMWAA